MGQSKQQTQKISKNKKRKSKGKDGCGFEVREFLESSSLHGVRYLTRQPGRHVGERFLWLCLLMLALGATGVIIAFLWSKFQTSPTITGLDADYHEWEVPFPAVTLCPHRPLDQGRLQHIINSSLGEDEGNDAGRTLQLLAESSYKNIASLGSISTLSFPYTSLRDVISQIVVRCEDILQKCLWKERPMDCCQYFQPVFTENGFCYSFNSLYAKLQNKRLEERNSSVEMRPRYIYETDPALSLTIHSPTVSSTHLIRVYIHAWNELVSVENRPQHEWSGYISRVVFSVKHTTTVPEARQLSVRQRRCVFRDEIPLLTAPAAGVEGAGYSYTACMAQCRILRAAELCRCTPFFAVTTESIPHCDIDGMRCLALFSESVTAMEPCDCELGCDHMVYEVEKLSDAATNTKGSLEIGFVSWPMVRYKREVLFGWVDLLVSFGGIAGLFLGFSLLSGVEILYYFTLRPACAALLKHKAKKKSSGPKCQQESSTPQLKIPAKFTKKQKSVKQLKLHDNKITPIYVPYMH